MTMTPTEIQYYFMKNLEVQQAILWQEAKGKLNAMLESSYQCVPNEPAEIEFASLYRKVKTFIEQVDELLA